LLTQNDAATLLYKEGKSCYPEASRIAHLRHLPTMEIAPRDRNSLQPELALKILYLNDASVTKTRS
jgi:hypothetical protein